MVRGSVVCLAPSGLPQVSSTLDSHPVQVLLPVLRGGQAAVARAVVYGTDTPELALRVQAVSSQAERVRQMERLVTMLTVAEATRADPARYPAVLPVLESFVVTLPGNQLQMPDPTDQYELWCDVMPWCRTSLTHSRHDVLAAGPSTAVARLLPLVRTVQAVHEHLNVVHRDITPNNVLLDSAVRTPARLLLADWGIAHTVTAGQTSTRTELVGNRGFSLPPEMLVGNQAVGLYTDAWYLGSLLVWLFTGQPPGPQHGADLLPGGLPGGRAGAELDQVVRGLCAVDPGQRIPVAEAAHRLDRLQHAGPTDWGPPTAPARQPSLTTLVDSPASPPQTTRPRRRAWWPVGVAVGLVVVAAVVMTVWRITHPAPDAADVAAPSASPSCWDDMPAGRCPDIDPTELLGAFPVKPEVEPPDCEELDVDYEADPDDPTPSWLLSCNWTQETGDESVALSLWWHRDSEAVAEHYRIHDMYENAAAAPPFPDGPDGPVYFRPQAPENFRTSDYDVSAAYCYAELPVCMETWGEPDMIAQTLTRFTSLTNREARGLAAAYSGSRQSSGPVAQESGTPDRGTIDIDRWVDEYVAAADQITTGHIVVVQEIVTGGWTGTSRLEVDMSGTDRYCAVETRGMSVVVVIVDDTAYVLRAGSDWEEMPRRLLSTREIHLNPAATVALQRTAITKVERVGSEEVGGVQTDHYVITYDTAKRTDVLFDISRDTILMGDTITADVWLDAQMRPIRYRSTLMMRKDMASGRVVQEAVYSDYGKPVTIEAPI